MYGHIASYVDTYVPRPQSYWSEWTLPLLMYGHIASYVDTHVPRPQSYWSEWTLPAFYPPDTAQPAYCAGGPYDGQPCDSDYGCGAAPGEAGHCKLMYPGQASDSDTYVPRPDERLGY